MNDKVSYPSSRFLKFVDLQDGLNGCWNWTGSKYYNGYGQFAINESKHIVAHRFSYQSFRGTIPEGFQLDHLCKNKACVNPGHLEAVTPYENNMRSNSRTAQQARQTHCKNNHPLFGANLRIEKDGSRRCIACVKEKNHQAWLATNREVRNAHRREIAAKRRESYE